MPSTRETVVWVVRHGASTFNLEGRCQGCSNAPELTEAGREAARKSGERLRRAGIEVVISSPLRRAVQTAFEIIDGLEMRDIQFDIDARLREIELPQWGGLPFAEIQRQFPEQFLTWRLRPFHFQMHSPWCASRFPVRDLYVRVGQFWRGLLAAYAGRSVLLVTHGGTGRALITTALGLDPNYFHGIQQSNCGISRLRFAASDHGARLDLLNDTSHLDARLPKLKEGKTGVRLLLIPAMEASATGLRQIASVLEPVAVDMVFATDTAGEHAASQIFTDRATGSMRQIPEDGWERWIQVAVESQKACPVLHVAVVASPGYLQRVLQQHFKRIDAVAERMTFTEAGITAVHFPGHGTPLVLQCMNMFAPEFTLAGVQV